MDIVQLQFFFVFFNNNDEIVIFEKQKNTTFGNSRPSEWPKYRRLHQIRQYSRSAQAAITIATRKTIIGQFADGPHHNHNIKM